MIVTLKNKYLSASIHSKGAELQTLVKNNCNYIWEIDTDYWNKTSPILFPIVGRLKEDTYLYEEKEYQLSRHGFARDYEFSVIHQTDTETIFSFTYNSETLVKFPFEFELQLSYTLNESCLTIGYQVKNLGISKMPFSIGAHPAFAIPNAFEEYKLCFNKKERFESYVLENDLFSGQTKTITSVEECIPLEYRLFEEDALVFKNLHSSEVTLSHLNKPILKMDYREFPYLGIWTKNKAPFLCIEPWLGLADHKDTSGHIQEKEGIQWLASKCNYECKFSIEIY
ncbi:aldose 1-epimerase family protein [Flavobacterium sp. NRK F7]|uniref:aldose 1-epimerase family protein n=1 Tax=Flavobacterium sp. NRK F7 TaxID=2954930 RepID=UPI002090ACBC|nr:aldose 1-epimerase family protein [Flavobacterium sp. NRK F7]MCO6162849.1 aldose 1-epimerase family protein [Flavobacterium sp. NRK F7]